MPSPAEPLIQAIADAVYQRLVGHLEASSRLSSDRLTYSQAKAAELLCVPVHTLRDTCRRGEVAPAKIGKSWRYSREILARFANGQ